MNGPVLSGRPSSAGKGARKSRAVFGCLTARVLHGAYANVQSGEGRSRVTIACRCNSAVTYPKLTVTAAEGRRRCLPGLTIHCLHLSHIQRWAVTFKCPLQRSVSTVNVLSLDDMTGNMCIKYYKYYQSYTVILLHTLDILSC